ncbi:MULTISPECIES: methylenetetrahydrofolate reductase [NAD(P)H] [Enterococcus]|uniref:methylenetetrahydrofolate reductase [NAD(P)H] n=1 Tax=Enterococcus TaxID=1350 RepID=UPI0022E15BCB|nr:methylenetetrahydrofolate reductase [NAD(P)H] [Enterococcus diestrammenae]
MTSATHASLSFEIFPPNTQVGEEKLLATLAQLGDLAPDFISVTCSNNKRNIKETTLKVAGYIKNQLGVPTIAHLPAAYLTHSQVKEILRALDQLGIHQVLALRGDILPDVPPTNDFRYASDLVAFINQQAPHFAVSGACYPEVHPESPDRVADIKNLKFKTDQGLEHLITQLFFDNDCFYQFQENCQLADINVPIIAGIMPIINRKQALRLIQTSEAKLPRKFLAILDKYEHNPVALRDAGLAYAVDQIVDLVTQDVAGIHLYTMNNAATARHIYQATASLFGKPAQGNQQLIQLG